MSVAAAASHDWAASKIVIDSCASLSFDRPALVVDSVDRCEWFRVEEAPNHVRGDPGDVVVEVTVEGRADPTNRPGGEHCSSVRRLEEDDVRAGPWFGGGGVVRDRQWERAELDVLDGRSQRFGRRKVQEVAWRAVVGVVAVDLETGCSPVDAVDAVVAEHSTFVGVVEDPCSSWVVIGGETITLPIYSI